MKRRFGIRGEILLAAGLIVLTSALWPIGHGLYRWNSARVARARKVDHHRGRAAYLAGRAALFNPSGGWERDHRQILEEAAAWHSRRAATFREVEDDRLDDEDLVDAVGEKTLASRLQRSFAEQPTSY